MSSGYWLAVVKLYQLVIKQLNTGRAEGLRFATNLKFWGAASGWQEFLLQLTVEKMHVFEVFTKKYLQWYGLMAAILLN